MRIGNARWTCNYSCCTVDSLACCTLNWAACLFNVGFIECQCLQAVIRRCLRTPCLLAGIGMGSTLPLNGIGTSPTLNSTNNCPLIALSHSLLLGALSCPATASSISLARPWRPFFFSSRPQTPFPARDKLQYPRQRPIASSPTNPTAVLPT